MLRLKRQKTTCIEVNMERKLTLFVLVLFMSSTVFSQIRFKDLDLDEELDFVEWYEDGRPFIEANFGLSQPKHKFYSGTMAKTGLGEFRLGYSTLDLFYENYLTEFDEKYFFVKNNSTDLAASNPAIGEYITEAWAFGFSKREGYGYRWKYVSVLPYSEHGIEWTRFKAKDFSTMPSADSAFAERFHDAFRFGTKFEGGLKIELASTIGLSVGYEGSVIFPRYMLWKHMGSFIVERVGIALIDGFVDEIVDSSPAAAPVVNFVLKNAFSFAFFSLQKEYMNWPFSTETPLTYENYKVGLSFVF